MRRSPWFWVLVVITCTLGPLLVREYTKKHPTNCVIIGDREYVDGHCIPYCPPHPSECG